MQLGVNPPELGLDLDQRADLVVDACLREGRYHLLRLEPPEVPALLL
jgi:hypothetical protein